MRVVQTVGFWSKELESVQIIVRVVRPLGRLDRRNTCCDVGDLVFAIWCW